MSTPRVPPGEPPVGATQLIRLVNDSNEAVEDLYLRTRQAADIAKRSHQAAQLAAVTAETAKFAHQTIQAEYPRRRAPLPRQRIFALLTVILDGVACYFAAQAMDGSQDTTFVWTALFLAVLATGEVALDLYRDRHLRAWRTVMIVLAAFVGALGILRFWYLAAIGTSGLIPAALGAALFTAVTAGFLFVGYRALRMAETPQTFRARRWAHTAAQAAQAARADAERNTHDRERLIDAYLIQVRRRVLEICTAEQEPWVEKAVRSHLLGEEQVLGEEQR
jgi:hypothetical protein